MPGRRPRPRRPLHVVVDHDDDAGEVYVRIYQGRRLVHSARTPGVTTAAATRPPVRLYLLDSGPSGDPHHHDWAERVGEAARCAPRPVRAHLAARVTEYHQPLAAGCAPYLEAITS
ncbi:hypothetical protein ACFXPX_38515 [Kitasatospora sp. NPDC059146]|uniref:hypothetical protein n=1 Tax=unclassified Kitasatospora TaxID=2633591 RepID=UPI0036C0C9FF